MFLFKGSDCKISLSSRILTWYGMMESFLMSLGFTKSNANSNLYFKVEGRRPVMLLLYVDDLFPTSKEKLIKYARRILATEFKMKDLGMMHYFLGIEVWENVYVIFLCQEKYTIDILKIFQMMDCKAISTSMESKLKLLCDASSESVDATMYRQMIGSLMYLKKYET